MMRRDKITGFDGGLLQHIHAYKLFITETVIIPFLVYRRFYISILLVNSMYCCNWMTTRGRSCVSFPQSCNKKFYLKI